MVARQPRSGFVVLITSKSDGPPLAFWLINRKQIFGHAQKFSTNG
jgi:hypothetical protein